MVVRAAKERQIPIRIGVNFGSLPPVGQIGKFRGLHRHADGVNKLAKAGEAGEGEFSVVDHMVATALWEISVLEDLDFDLIKISLKAFDVPTTVEAYRRLAYMVPYPLHLGITEAGTAMAGVDSQLRWPGLPAVRGHRRHDTGVPQRGLQRGGRGRATRY